MAHQDSQRKMPVKRRGLWPTTNDRRRFLHPYRLLAGNRHRGQPVEAVGFFSADDGEEFFLQGAGDGANFTVRHGNSIHGTDRRDLGRGAGEEGLVGDVKHFARDAGFGNRNAKFARQLHN